MEERVAAVIVVGICEYPFMPLLRAKLNSLLNYVDKGQNKGQLRDFSLFLEKP